MSAPPIVAATPTPARVSSLVPFALAAVWVIWGSTYLAIRIGLETLDPFVMQATRFSIAALILGTIAHRRGESWPAAGAARNAALIGLMLLVGGVGVVTLAEDRGLDSGVAATLIAVQPVMGSIWGGLFGRWPRRWEWIGMLVGLSGVVVLSASGSLSGSRLGVLMVMFACVNWSLGSVISRHITMPPGMMATVCEMGAAAIGFVALAVLHGESITRPSGRSLAALLYLATVGSVIAFSAYMYLVGHVRPSLAMSYAYVNPAIAVVLGALIADEVITTNLLIALPIIIIGVAIVTRSQAGSPA